MKTYKQSSSHEFGHNFRQPIACLAIWNSEYCQFYGPGYSILRNSTSFEFKSWSSTL